MVTIYLAVLLLTQSCCLPFPAHRLMMVNGPLTLPAAEMNSTACKPGYTWHYSTQGLPGLLITEQTCELLPHIFTLIPALTGTVIFCGTFSPTGRDRPLTGVLPFAVRTFLTAFGGAVTRLIVCKDNPNYLSRGYAHSYCSGTV